MDLLPSLLIFAFIAAITPGPNNIMIMASGVNFGVRRSLPHLLGISLGFLAMMIALGFGAGFMFERYPQLHDVIKIVGILYLGYLAWKIATSAASFSNKGKAGPFTFMQAALFQWVNPKAWVMGTTALATFTTAGADINLQITVIIAVFFMMTWPSVSIWLLFGAALQRVLSKPQHYKVFNISMAILLIVIMYPVIMDLISRYRF